MSPAYFSTMFRKVTGQTYIAYLTEVRLQKAVELLNETDDKTYVIAQKVGYQSEIISATCSRSASVFHRRNTAAPRMADEEALWQRKKLTEFFSRVSIRSTIYLYFTISALTALILMGISFYGRLVGR